MTLKGSKLKTVKNVISNIEMLITRSEQHRSATKSYFGHGSQNQSDDFRKLSLALAAKGKNVDSEKIKEIISLYNLLSHKKDESVDKSKSLSDTLADFLSTGGSKDSKHINSTSRQEISQQVSSTSEMFLTEDNENFYE